MRWSRYRGGLGEMQTRLWGCLRMLLSPIWGVSQCTTGWCGCHTLRVCAVASVIDYCFSNIFSALPYSLWFWLRGHQRVSCVGTKHVDVVWV